MEKKSRVDQLVLVFWSFEDKHVRWLTNFDPVTLELQGVFNDMVGLWTGITYSIAAVR